MNKIEQQLDRIVDVIKNQHDNWHKEDVTFLSQFGYIKEMRRDAIAVRSREGVVEPVVVPGPITFKYTDKGNKLVHLLEQKIDGFLALAQLRKDLEEWYREERKV